MQRSRRLSKKRRSRNLRFERLERRKLLAVFTVIQMDDELTGNCNASECSIRDAVEAANQNPGADDIVFSPSLSGTIRLQSENGAIEIKDSLRILGPGSDQLIFLADTATAEFRVVDALPSAGDVEIKGVTLTGGRVLSDAGGGIRFQSEGQLTIRESVISGNDAANGGGVYSSSNGTVAITASSISNNRALYGVGGGIHSASGDVSLESSLVEGNSSYTSGGGIYSQGSGDVTVTNSKVSNNQVSYEGYSGGGIFSDDGAVTIASSELSGNVSRADGGALYSYAGVVKIVESEISANSATYFGGGVAFETGTASVSKSTLTSNQSNDGGGISTQNASVTISRSLINQNVVAGDGGGMFTSKAPLELVNSTVSGNRASIDGGGIASRSGDVELINVTLSSNSAASNGGGIHSEDASITIASSTITENEASTQGGGIDLLANNTGERIELSLSIVAGNIAASHADMTAPANPVDLVIRYSLLGDLDGTLLQPSDTSNGMPIPDTNGNLIGGGGAAILDPSLTPLSLQSNGLLVHRLEPVSIAIDAGAVSVLSQDRFDLDGDQDVQEPIPVDQLGANRVVGATVDLGSVERVYTLDFGDAPDPYPVTEIEDGARHQAGSLHFGPGVSTEPNGDHSPDADADLLDDGIVRVADLVVDSSVPTLASFSIWLSEPGIVDAWIDFDRDGDWDDVSDSIISSVALDEGLTTIPITIPPDASIGKTSARFRVSSRGSLSPTGFEVDGEVEDYQLDLLGASDRLETHVVAPENIVVIQERAGQTLVGSTSVDWFSVPTFGMASVDVQLTDQDDFVTLDLRGSPIPSEGISIDGRDGVNQLIVQGDEVELDSTGSDFGLKRFQRIELDATHSAVIYLDTASVTELTSDGLSLTIAGDVDDHIVFHDAAQWRMSEPTVVNGKFFPVAQSLTDAARVVGDMMRPWQNFVENSDVNNDGRVSGSDAIRIINELARRVFSDSQSRLLDEAIDVDPWPNVYFDQNGDSRVSALDALRVINQMARLSAGGIAQGEQVLSLMSDEKGMREQNCNHGPQRISVIQRHALLRDNPLQRADTERESLFDPGHVRSEEDGASRGIDASCLKSQGIDFRLK